MINTKYETTITLQTKTGRVVGKASSINVTQTKPTLYHYFDHQPEIPQNMQVSGDLFLLEQIDIDFLDDRIFGSPNSPIPEMDIVIDCATGKMLLLDAVLYFDLKYRREVFPEELLYFVGKLEFECSGIEKESKLNE